MKNKRKSIEKEKEVLPDYKLVTISEESSSDERAFESGKDIFPSVTKAKEAEAKRPSRWNNCQQVAHSTPTVHDHSNTSPGVLQVSSVSE